MGRKSTYTDEVADAICGMLAEGMSLNAICMNNATFPAESTVRLWVQRDECGFSAKYARAREIGYEHHADKIIELADTCRIGVKTTTKDDGKTETVEGDMVERTRLQIDARKWILAKMLPKKYGDRLHTEHSGEMTVRAKTDVSDDELANIATGSGG